MIQFYILHICMMIVRLSEAGRIAAGVVREIQYRMGSDRLKDVSYIYRKSSMLKKSEDDARDDERRKISNNYLNRICVNATDAINFLNDINTMNFSKATSKKLYSQFKKFLFIFIVVFFEIEFSPKGFSFPKRF